MFLTFQLHVSGGNLTSVCKLVFKISKEEKHDSLFLENNILGKLINMKPLILLCDCYGTFCEENKTVLLNTNLNHQSGCDHFHFHHHQEEAAGTLVLWDPRRGSPGSCHKTYVQVFLGDTGLENISELISLMEDRNLWKSTAVYRHDDDGRPRLK